MEMTADKLTIHEGSGRGPTKVQFDVFSCVIQLLLSLWRNPSVTGNRPAGSVFVVSEFIRENRRALCVFVCIFVGPVSVFPAKHAADTSIATAVIHGKLHFKANDLM